jgi:hypothetical protein
MRRTEQGLRLMKFGEVYRRTCRGGLSQAEAAEISASGILLDEAGQRAA